MDEDRNKREATFFFQFAFKLSNSEPGTKKKKKTQFPWCHGCPNVFGFRSCLYLVKNLGKETDCVHRKFCLVNQLELWRGGLLLMTEMYYIKKD